MTKDEMKQKCEGRAKIFQQAMESCKSSSPMDCIEWFADRIVELQEEISILLSCKNCPESKGGYICQKEYEGKCLSQKIQYIKELQEENAELKKQINIRSCQNCKHNNKSCPNDGSCKNYSKWEGFENPQLTKAKEIIEKLLPYAKPGKHDKQDLQSIDRFCESIHEAELFLKESE